jgi:hypothetical protein
MAALRRVDQPGKLPVWVEVQPEQCPLGGEPFVPGRMWVGWLPCACEAAVKSHKAGKGMGHRTVGCREHDAEWLLPPCQMQLGPHVT